MRRTQEEINLHNQKIMNFLNNDRKSSKQFCNRTLSSQGENFAINDGVLASMSGFFKAMFKTEMKEKYESSVKLSDTISPKRLETVLDFIYTGDVELTEENILEVLEDADYTQIKDLKLFCNKFILGMVTTDSCLKLRKYAARYKLDDVEKKTNKMIADNIAAIVQHDHFKELDFNDMSEIIKLRGKDCEEVVFLAIVKWVDYNPHQREELFVKLFSQLDLSLMTTDFLQQVSNQKLVRSNLVCTNMLIDLFWKTQNGSTKFLLIGGIISGTDCAVYDCFTREAKPCKKLNPGRYGHTSTRVGRKVYVMGGEKKKCKVLDLDENTWNEIPDMLEARKYCGSECIGDFLYVTGGLNDGPLQTCEKFHIPDNKWTKIKSMLYMKWGHGTVVNNDFLYCIGGWNGKKPLKSCEYYDARSDEWKEFPSLLEARSGFACVAMNGFAYAIGGKGICGNYLYTVERYSFETNNWEYVAPLPFGRYCHSACVVGQKILVIGGKDQSECKLESVEVYDSVSNIWEYFLLQN